MKNPKTLEEAYISIYRPIAEGLDDITDASNEDLNEIERERKLSPQMNRSIDATVNRVNGNKQLAYNDKIYKRIFLKHLLDDPDSDVFEIAKNFKINHIENEPYDVTFVYDSDVGSGTLKISKEDDPELAELFPIERKIEEFE